MKLSGTQRKWSGWEKSIRSYVNLHQGKSKKAVGAREIGQYKIKSGG